MSDNKNEARCRVTCRGRRLSMRVFFIALPVLALLKVMAELSEVTWVSSFLQDEKGMNKRSLVTTMARTKTTTLTPSPKVPLYLITASGRPELLTKSVFHILPFLDEENNCGFDVHWIVVHNYPDERLSKAPLFRNVFPWITELYAYNESSSYGDHERNVAIEHILTHADDDTGLVYFLDDDNALTLDLCRKNARSPLRADHMYYGGIFVCDSIHPRSPRWDQPYWRRGDNITLNFYLVSEVDTGNFLTPLWLFRQEFFGGGTQGSDGIRWKLQNDTGSDGLFFTEMVRALLQTDGSEDRLIELPHSSVKFHYNHLSWCMHPEILPWGQWQKQLNASLTLYRDQVQEMHTLWESLSPQQKTNRPDVSFHDYAHMLYLLRSSVEKEPATYVEIGVGKGASSIFMSRHPMVTKVIGIDRFVAEHQLEEVEGYAQHLKGDGPISWIKSGPKLALPQLQEQLNGSSIDLLFIAGNQSMEDVQTSFVLYAPMVSEGGWVVIDGFMDSVNSAGTREAVMHLIKNHDMKLNDYEVIGCLPNDAGAGPLLVKDKYFYDWQNRVSNEFLLRKLGGKR